MSEAIGALLLFAAASLAAQPCPYLNAATAAGLLGGDVTASVKGDICTFAHGSSQLRIEVQTVSLPHKALCEPNPAPLKAIGNEAFACGTADKAGNISEEIAGRVRDRVFFIRLTSNNIARAALRERARSVAEQVAGILY